MALARDRVRLTSDVVTAASTNYTPVTGLSFPVTVGNKYHIRAVLLHTQAAATTGARMGFSASPATAATVGAFMLYTADGVGTLDGGGWGQATNSGLVTTGSTTGGATAPAASADTSSLLILEGIWVPSVSQILQLEIGPEAAAAVTVKAGSYVEWELV